MPTKHPTTIRLDMNLYKDVKQQARKVGMSFSSVVHMLLLAFTDGSVKIGVSQYPKGYLEALTRESDELSLLARKGKVKGFSSSKKMFEALHAG